MASASSGASVGIAAGPALRARLRRRPVLHRRQRIGGLDPTTPVGDQFSGNALVDIAFDDVTNLGALRDAPHPFLPQIPTATHSGKGHVKHDATSRQPASMPTWVFVAVGDASVVDVFELATGRRITSVAAPGVQSLGAYWRQ